MGEGEENMLLAELQTARAEGDIITFDDWKKASEGIGDVGAEDGDVGMVLMEIEQSIMMKDDGDGVDMGELSTDQLGAMVSMPITAVSDSAPASAPTPAPAPAPAPATATASDGPPSPAPAPDAPPATAP